MKTMYSDWGKICSMIRFVLKRKSPLDYNRVAPSRVLKKIVAPQAKNGLRVESARIIGTAKEEPEAVAVATAPDPAEAVPVDVPPAFWLPGPLRPGALPAPLPMYFSAPSGIVGSSSPVKSVTSHVWLRCGHLLGEPFAL